MKKSINAYDFTAFLIFLISTTSSRRKNARGLEKQAKPKDRPLFSEIRRCCHVEKYLPANLKLVESEGRVAVVGSPGPITDREIKLIKNRRCRIGQIDWSKHCKSVSLKIARAVANSGGLSRIARNAQGSCLTAKFVGFEKISSGRRTCGCRSDVEEMKTRSQSIDGDAVVDSGLILRPISLHGQSFLKSKRWDKAEATRDEDGHGTMVASLSWENGIGIAPQGISLFTG